jgi:DNA-binding NarL/FixJ family response regulator
LTIRLVIADDHPIVLGGLETLLQTSPGFEVVARCDDSRTVVRAVMAQKPDVVLLDLRMPNRSGLEIMAELNERAPGTRVVLLTGAITEDELMEAMRLGVRGILLKDMAPRLLLECVRKVHNGEQWLEKASTGRAIAKMLKRETGLKQVTGMLTRRELELMRLVLLDLSNKEIADKLYITPGTVKIHLHSVYTKLGVNGRVELKHFAREKGLL